MLKTCTTYAVLMGIFRGDKKDGTIQAYISDDEQPRKMKWYGKQTFFARAGTTGIDGLQKCI